MKHTVIYLAIILGIGYCATIPKSTHSAQKVSSILTFSIYKTLIN